MRPRNPEVVGVQDREAEYGFLVDALRELASNPRIAKALADRETPKWLRISEAVHVYRLSKSRLYEMIASGEIRSCSLPGSGRARFSRRVLASSLDSYFEKNATGGTTTSL